VPVRGRPPHSAHRVDCILPDNRKQQLKTGTKLVLTDQNEIQEYLPTQARNQIAGPSDRGRRGAPRTSIGSSGRPPLGNDDHADDNGDEDDLAPAQQQGVSRQRYEA
jgi:hypothetical protein